MFSCRQLCVRQTVYLSMVQGMKDDMEEDRMYNTSSFCSYSSHEVFSRCRGIHSGRYCLKSVQLKEMSELTEKCSNQ